MKSLDHGMGGGNLRNSSEHSIVMTNNKPGVGGGGALSTSTNSKTMAIKGSLPKILADHQQGRIQQSNAQRYKLVGKGVIQQIGGGGSTVPNHALRNSFNASDL